MKVKDIMTKKVITVNAQTSILDVSKLLSKHHIHGIPVVDEEHQVIGIIAESDFFIKELPDFYLPSFINFLQQTKFAHRLQEEWQKELGEITSAKAGDIMTQECITINPGDNLKKLQSIFKKHRIYTVPVVDEQEKLVGVVTVSDLIQNL